MVFRVVLSLLRVVTLVVLAGTSHASERLALVIGNASYSEIPPLDNPANDARLVAQTLEDLGFDVTLALDLTHTEMRRQIGAFGEALEAAGPDVTALAYYAGHAVQLGGANYLLPVDAAIGDESDISIDGLHLDIILHQIDHARPAAAFVILDACRDNPFGQSVTLSPGLARTGAPRDTLLAYSTAPGKVALDGIGPNSPYSEALAKALTQPGLSAEDMFKEVRRTVLATTGGVQTPWESSSLTRAVSFNPVTEETVGSAAPAISAVPEGYWDERDWADMTDQQRAAWRILGWSEQAWSEQVPPPESEGLSWRELTPQQRQAAHSLGITAETW